MFGRETGLRIVVIMVEKMIGAGGAECWLGSGPRGVCSLREKVSTKVEKLCIAWKELRRRRSVLLRPMLVTVQQTLFRGPSERKQLGMAPALRLRSQGRGHGCRAR